MIDAMRLVEAIGLVLENAPAIELRLPAIFVLLMLATVAITQRARGIGQ